jgi:hypothetical protein
MSIKSKCIHQTIFRTWIISSSCFSYYFHCLAYKTIKSNTSRLIANQQMIYWIAKSFFFQLYLPFAISLLIIKSTQITDRCFLISILNISYFCFSSVNDNKIRSLLTYEKQKEAFYMQIYSKKSNFVVVCEYKVWFCSEFKSPLNRFLFFLLLLISFSCFFLYKNQSTAISINALIPHSTHTHTDGSDDSIVKNKPKIKADLKDFLFNWK